VATKFVGYLKDSYSPVITEAELCLLCNEKTGHCIKH